MGAMRWCRHCKKWMTHDVHCAEATTLYTESAYGALRRAIDGGWDVDHVEVWGALDELDEAHPIAATIDATKAAARAEGYAEAVADVVAWLRASPGLDRAMNATTFAANRIESGAHVGAAKKGGE